jgi:hypothetical protein
VTGEVTVTCEDDLRPWPGGGRCGVETKAPGEALNFMLCGQIAERFVLIGDPGQIPPVVALDVSRRETSPRAPHVAAPKIVLTSTTFTA